MGKLARDMVEESCVSQRIVLKTDEIIQKIQSDEVRSLNNEKHN